MTLKDGATTGKCMRSRRAWMMNMVALGIGSVFGRNVPIHAAEPIAVPEGAVQRFMMEAFEMRRRAVAAGDQAYGAVLVKDGLIVGAAPSRVVTNTDPTAHAEMEALRDAAVQLASRDLSGCVLYSSSPPCPMCEAAAYWAHIERLYYGDPIRDGGAPSLRAC